jgi:uncharacterized protein
MPLVFETAALPLQAAPLRTDVACFIGHVARRTAQPVPEPVRAALRAAGWIDGPWAATPQRIESLLQLPVALDGWSDFDRLFDWRSRPVHADTPGAVCASALGASVRSFFASGGRRAIVLRVGDPWPVLEATPPTAAQRDERRRLVLPPAADFNRFDPSRWLGLFHLFGLAEVAMLCLPDLPELWAGTPPPPALERPLAPLPEVFVECSSGEAPPPADLGLRRIAAPRLDAAGFNGWAAAVGQVREFLSLHRRDCLFVGALPLAGAEAPDLFGADIFAAEGTPAGGPSSAFVQLAAPWLRTRVSDDLPQRLAPPDGVLAGVLAANALGNGCFRSAAGWLVPHIVEAEPAPAWGLAPDAPWPRLAERVCVFAPQPDGWALQSDVTTAPAKAWRGGQASRLVASVLRAAREIGAPLVFAPNGPALWAKLRRALEQLLLTYWQAGGLGGASAEEAFQVRCDRSTMTQNDLDAGRVIALVTLLPVAAVDRITVSMALGAAERSELVLAQAA